MQEKLNNITWALKQKELLEKLSLEISRNFSISEKLAKKLIYETHLNLDSLKKDILTEKDMSTESFNSLSSDTKKLEKLFFAVKWAKEFIEKASKSEIKELKDILEKNDILSREDNKIIQKLFNQKLIEKAKNPQNISEQILSGSLWILNSGIIITDVLYNLWKWIITSIPDFISIINWTWEIESLKKV